MNTALKTIVATTATTLLLAAGSASAMVSDQEAHRHVNAALLGSGSVNISIDNGVATVSGVVEDGIDENRALQAAAAIDGVDHVIDLIFRSN